MSRTEATNKHLMQLRTDIQKQASESPAFYFFNKEKINRFYKQNTMLLKILDSRLEEFIKKYVKHGEDGTPLTEEQDGKMVYSFADEKDREAYLADQTEFLNRSINIEL